MPSQMLCDEWQPLITLQHVLEVLDAELDTPNLDEPVILEAAVACGENRDKFVEFSQDVMNQLDFSVPPDEYWDMDRVEAHEGFDRLMCAPEEYFTCMELRQRVVDDALKRLKGKYNVLWSTE
jgi:hypothetical protein